MVTRRLSAHPGRPAFLRTCSKADTRGRPAGLPPWGKRTGRFQYMKPSEQTWIPAQQQVVQADTAGLQGKAQPLLLMDPTQAKVLISLLDRQTAAAGRTGPPRCLAIPATAHLCPSSAHPKAPFDKQPRVAAGFSLACRCGPTPPAHDQAPPAQNIQVSHNFRTTFYFYLQRRSVFA